MRQLTTIDSLRAAVADTRRARGPGATVGFVPTMGNLHAGHLALVAEAQRACDISVVSVYVNPLQFGPNEDLDSYPRTLDADREALATAGADLLFVPTDAVLYPDGRENQTRVVVPGLCDILCGRSRPGHFDGVATVVLKLLNIVQPDAAFFGQKDFQQLTMLKTMVRQLNVSVRIVGVPTQRAPSGLALSSRNQYLSASERERAPALSECLQQVAKQLAAGDRDFGALERGALVQLSAAGFDPDYCEIRNPDDLSLPHRSDGNFVVLAAARLGRARLIDNIRVSGGRIGD
jgi:pantoate--beta-alanine ligase